MPKVHVIIPTYNHYNLLHNLLWSLYKYEGRSIDSVTVINNGSTDETSEGLKWWRQEMTLFPVYEHGIEKNIGFLLASNEGLQSVIGFDDTKRDDIFILLSNDVKILGKFIEQIKDIFSANVKSLVGGILYSHSTGWNVFGKNPPIPYLEGWLLASTSEGWSELGYFDEQFFPNDYEDMDLSMTAIKLGYELVPLNNVGLHHLSGKTIGYGEDRLKVTNINREKLREKWKLPYD